MGIDARNLFLCLSPFLYLDLYYVLGDDTLIGYLGDNCIQNFHLGRYIVGITVGNLVLP